MSLNQHDRQINTNSKSGTAKGCPAFACVAVGLSEAEDFFGGEDYNFAEAAELVKVKVLDVAEDGVDVFAVFYVFALELDDVLERGVLQAVEYALVHVVVDALVPVVDIQPSDVLFLGAVGA